MSYLIAKILHNVLITPFRSLGPQTQFSPRQCQTQTWLCMYACAYKQTWNSYKHTYTRACDKTFQTDPIGVSFRSAAFLPPFCALWWQSNGNCLVPVAVFGPSFYMWQCVSFYTYNTLFSTHDGLSMIFCSPDMICNVLYKRLRSRWLSCSVQEINAIRTGLFNCEFFFVAAHEEECTNLCLFLACSMPTITATAFRWHLITLLQSMIQVNCVMCVLESALTCYVHGLCSSLLAIPENSSDDGDALDGDSVFLHLSRQTMSYYESGMVTFLCLFALFLHTHTLGSEHSWGSLGLCTTLGYQKTDTVGFASKKESTIYLFFALLWALLIPGDELSARCQRWQKTGRKESWCRYHYRDCCKTFWPRPSTCCKHQEML